MTISDAPSQDYRVLARKYRPDNFGDLVGQEAMVRTLRNSFASGRIAQAWMLTGIRGVGKTTTARILARGLNYETDTLKSPTVDLETHGIHCEGIIQGNHVDVIEMDAASHTSIEDIKQIIDSARYAPVSARYKVYIIDEVHMISDKAFNALLKTLEEPPAHVKFIFATTEIRKVPVTILSRCQRFDLRRVEADQLHAHLSSILEKESLEAEPGALQLIARAAEGSVRDALSILDQAIAFSTGSITADQLHDMLGLADRGQIVSLFEHLMGGDMSAALDALRNQYSAGAEPLAILSDLATFTHLVTRMKFVPALRTDPMLSEVEREQGGKFADGLSVRVLSRSWQMLLKGIQEVQQSSRQIEAAEMLLIRLAHAADLPTLDEALKYVSENKAVPALSSSSNPNGHSGSQESRDPAGNASLPSQTANAVSAPPAAPLAQSAQLAQSPRSGLALASVTQIADQIDKQPESATEYHIPSFEALMALVDEKRDVQLKVALKNGVVPVHVGNGRIEIALKETAPKSLVTDLQDKLLLWTGQRWIISIVNAEGGKTLAEIELEKHQALMDQAQRDPDISEILTAFPGSKITNVQLKDQ